MKLLMFLAIPCSGWLWGYAGAAQTDKNWRRIGIGITIAGFALIISYNIYIFLIIPLMFFATSRGYGTPDSTDEGSNFGRFWFSVVRKPSENRFNQSEMTAFLANLLTRITVSILYALALLPLVTIGSYYGGFICIVIGIPLFNAYHKSYMIGIYNTAELGTGAILGLGAFLAIL